MHVPNLSFKDEMVGSSSEKSGFIDWRSQTRYILSKNMVQTIEIECNLFEDEYVIALPLISSNSTKPGQLKSSS